MAITEPFLREYMQWVEAGARAYDQEAITMSSKEFEALYDDAFFEAMELENELQ